MHMGKASEAENSHDSVMAVHMKIRIKIHIQSILDGFIIRNEEKNVCNNHPLMVINLTLTEMRAVFTC